MPDPSKPVTAPDNGFELCYECDGSRLCWSCRGKGRRSNGDRCRTCAGDGLCIVCAGNGQLPAGTKASVDGHVSSGNRVARRVGAFRELGYDNAPALAEVRGKRSERNKEKVVAYLRAGKVLVMSPGLVRDPFDRSLVAGKGSIRTDGVYAWPDSLAYFVDQYLAELPSEFEEHMAKVDWTMPAAIDVKGLEVD